MDLMWEKFDRSINQKTKDTPFYKRRGVMGFKGCMTFNEVFCNERIGTGLADQEFLR